MSNLIKYNNTFVILPENYIPSNEKSHDLLLYYFKTYYNLIYLNIDNIKKFINNNNNSNNKIIFYFLETNIYNPNIYNFYLKIINFIQGKNDIKSNIFIFTFDFWIRGPGCYSQLIAKTFSPKNYKVITFAFNLQHLKIFLTIENTYTNNIIYNNYWASYKESYQPFNNNPILKIFLSGVICDNYPERQILKSLNYKYIYHYEYNLSDTNKNTNNYNIELNKYIACFTSSVYVNNIKNELENTHAILLKVFEILASGSLLIMPLIEEKYLNNIGLFHKLNCYLININDSNQIISDINYIIDSKNRNEINIIRKKGQDDAINNYNYEKKFIELNNIINKVDTTNVNQFYIHKSRFRRNNLHLRCLQDTYLIRHLNHDQSSQNKIPLKKGKLLGCIEIIDISSVYYKIILK